MLDTAFARWPRDIGQNAGLPFPVRHHRIAHATVARVVRRQRLDPSTRAAFVGAARSMVEAGATLITTSCGFLYREQAVLTQALDVPVVSSSLVALPLLHAVHGGQGVPGILTFDAEALGPIGMPGGPSCAVQGLPADGHFRAVIEGRCRQAEPDQLQAEAIAAAKQLASQRPSVVVLECTNLAPWRDAIADAVGVPVVDLVDVIGWALSLPGAIAPQSSARKRSR